MLILYFFNPKDTLPDPHGDLTSLISFKHMCMSSTVYRVYFNALIISEEAKHCENKNHEILRYVQYYEHVA